MVWRAEAIRAKLLRLDEVTTKLELFAQRDRAELEELEARWSVERGLQLGAELLFDIGEHILSARFGVSAQDYKTIVPQLAEHGVVSHELSERLKGLAGFRNILVHEYARLDPALVLAHLAKAPVDFSDFIAAIRRWLDAQPA